MSNIIKVITHPELHSREYRKLLLLEGEVDLTIYSYPVDLSIEIIDEELTILQYIHGPYGDGGWDFLQTVIYELAEIINNNKEQVVIHILENVLKEKMKSITNCLFVLRKRSSLKKFVIYIAKDKANYSSFTVNSHLTDSEFKTALDSLLNTFKRKSLGSYVYDRKSKDWLEE